MLKRRTVRLREDSNVDAQMLLNQVEGLIKCECKRGKLSVVYDMPACDYQIIWDNLHKHGWVKQDSAFEKIRHDLIIFTEKNECDYLAMPSGWDFHMQNLHLILAYPLKMIKGAI